MDKWLDKLQDGAQFEGTTNKGFDYNGAWGGQFQKGGKMKPLYVSSKKDPRYKAYQDSLGLYNMSKAALATRHVDPNISQKEFEKKMKESAALMDAVRAKSKETGIKPIGLSDLGHTKPKQPVIIGEKPKPRAKQQSLESISPRGLYTSQGITPNEMNLRPMAKPAPDYYNVQENINAYGGGQSNYRVDNTNDLRQVGPGNTQTVTPHYPGGFNYQNGGNMNYYKSGIDFEPKSISQSGSVITDEMGQWKYPGEVTRIPSNDITMKGVPYDVVGISDTGDKKLMKPGKDYKFKGKSVTEYPIAQDGKELKQLLNFTNKPDKRWLDNL